MHTFKVGDKVTVVDNGPVLEVAAVGKNTVAIKGRDGELAVYRLSHLLPHVEPVTVGCEVLLDGDVSCEVLAVAGDWAWLRLNLKAALACPQTYPIARLTVTKPAKEPQ